MSTAAGSLVDLAALSPMERAALAAQLTRESVRDKSYQLLPLGEDVAAYMRAKRQRQAPNTRKAYESSLDKLARYFPDLRVEDFEPPVGTERLQAFLDAHWRDAEPATYNLHLSVVGSFFDHWQRMGRLYGDPTKAIDRARRKQSAHPTFTDDERRAILAAASLRDRIALRLMFDYALRQAALKAVRFKHFDHQRRRLTIFTKGSKVRAIPLPDPHLWQELERHILDVAAAPDDFLVCLERPVPRVGVRRFPDREVSRTTLHRWFYRRQQDAGIVPEGVFSSGRERSMHAARHTAGQRLLDATGNLKAVQSLLGHASITTTAEVYTSWDEERRRGR